MSIIQYLITNQLSTNNTTNLSKSALFELLGSTATTDIIYAYIISPISILGIILNAICLFVLSKHEFKSKKIFKYLKMYVWCSAIICFGPAFIYLIKVHALFEYTNSYYIRFAGCYISRPLVLVSYFFSAVIDILITLERIAAFKPKYNISEKINFNSLCFISILIGFLLNIPLVLSLYPTFIIWRLNETETEYIYYVDVTEFGGSTYGKLIIGFTFLVKDILVALIGLFFNVLLMILFKKHVDKKEGDLKHKRHLNQVLQHNNKNAVSTESNMNIKEQLLRRSDKRLTYMIISLSILTFIEHLIIIIGNVSIIIIPGLTSSYLNLVTFVFLALKYSLNIVIFSFFNTIFHDSLMKSLKFGF